MTYLPRSRTDFGLNDESNLKIARFTAQVV